MPSPHVVVVGGGLAGLAAAVALAEQGIRVSIIERHPRLGGRATSYTLPDGETIDNCQHVTLRCCTNLDDFYGRIGVSGDIKYYDRFVFADSKGKRAEIKCRHLPAPLHLTASFATFRLLNWTDKFAIARAMLRIVGAGGKPTLDGAMSMLDWLKQNKQTPNAIDRFWRVVLVSALNEQLDRIDAAYGIDVFWKAFLSNRDAFGMGIPAVRLEALYAPAAELIRRCGGAVRTKCGSAELKVFGAEVVAIQLDDGGVLKGDYYVAAVPLDRLLKMLPESLRNIDALTNAGKLRHSPITSVHLWFDRSVMTEPFVASVDQNIQWVFSKDAKGRNVQIVISASHSLADKSQQDVVDLCRKELADLVPATRRARLERSIVVRENAATFAPEPGCDRWRPTERTPLRNLFLAGDWTRTGWPATMEGAVRSGYRAAETILGIEGKPVQLVRPDMPVSGLVRWLGSVLG
jgi:squalene-associated FAD-dependent desaturase